MRMRFIGTRCGIGLELRVTSEGSAGDPTAVSPVRCCLLRDARSEILADGKKGYRRGNKVTPSTVLTHRI